MLLMFCIFSHGHEYYKLSQHKRLLYILIEEIIIYMKFQSSFGTDKTESIHIMGVVQRKRTLSVARIVF